jgi:hypothetical protein
MPAWSFAAQAGEMSTPYPVVGFADLVAKVKPVVISVRVKLDEPQSASENEEDQEITAETATFPWNLGSRWRSFSSSSGSTTNTAIPTISELPVRVRDFSSQPTVMQ